MESNKNGSEDSDAKSVIKAFIRNENQSQSLPFNKDHLSILKSAVFIGYEPKIVDSVFSLGLYPIDKIREQRKSTPKTVAVNSHPDPLLYSIPNDILYEKPGYYFTTFEYFLIIVNLLLLAGISATFFLYFRIFSPYFI